MQSLSDVLGQTLDRFEQHGCLEGWSVSDIHHALGAIADPATPESDLRFYCEMLQLALASRQGREVLECISAAVLKAGHSESAIELLLECLAFAANWANRVFDLKTAIAVVTAPHLARWRQMLARTVLEPVLYASQRDPTPEQWSRLSLLGDESEDMRFVLHRMGGTFIGKLQTEVDRNLGHGPRRVLMVQNIRDGQGDEIIRCVPLMQALLDFNPELTIVLLTKRHYLYAHTRVKTVRLDDSVLVAEELETEFDGVVDFFESNVLAINHDGELESKIESYVQNNRPAVLLASEKAYNHFVYKGVEIEGRCYAQSLGLDRQRVNNVYETTLRLLAEMGLPLRIGQNMPRSEWVLAGYDWPAAAAEWDRLTQSNVDKRPVALLGPFGGAAPLKGFTEFDRESLAARISRLIAKGFFVVLAPNGTEWGSAAAAKSVVAHLSPGDQVFIAIVPDSGESIGSAALSPPACELSDRDIRTRMLIYFIRFASLIVAVEGWMIHAAYCLGKPYRTLMMAYSHPPDWHPFAQTSQQQIDWPLQALKIAPQSPLLVEQPGKFLLIALVRLCGVSPDPRASNLLYRARCSPDHDLRAAAVAGLSDRRDDTAHESLVAALEDPSYRVRAVAAEALLLRDSAIPRETLVTHAYIAQTKRDWAAILRLGNSAIPALEVTARDEDDVIRREATWAIEYLRWISESRRQRLPRRGMRILSRVIRVGWLTGRTLEP